MFRPWVGAHYSSSPIRLLVVGESHYGHPSEDQPGLTTETIEKWRTGVNRLRYYTKLAQVLTGSKATDLKRAEALNEIAFYNFLQNILSWDNKGRAEPSDWKAAQEPFLGVVRDLDPTHILVTSHGTYRRMPAALNERDEVIAGKTFHVCEYLTPSGRAWATEMPHLSRISAVRWSERIEAFRELPPIRLGSAGE